MSSASSLIRLEVLDSSSRAYLSTGLSEPTENSLDVTDPRHHVLKDGISLSTRSLSWCQFCLVERFLEHSSLS